MPVSAHTLREPSGELVGLDFYFSRLSSADAIEAIVIECLKAGGVCSNKVYVTQFEGARAAAFEGAYSDKVRQINVTEDSLLMRLAEAHQRVVRIPIKGAIGIGKSEADVVTFNGVSKAASLLDSHPISIAADGWVFSTPGHEREADKAGKRCYKKFVAYCHSLQPDYAAILNEDSLPSFHDLKRATQSRCFCDFFVSEEVYGEQVVERLEQTFHDAYVERTEKGIYVSTTPWYNPKRKGLDRLDALERSADVSKLLSAR